MIDLKNERSKFDLTQEQLAEKCETKRSTIAMIEVGANKPSVELAKKLGETLEFDWTKFFT